MALVAKPNFRLLGKKVGKKMNAVQQVVLQFDQKKLNSLLSGQNVEIEVEGESFVLLPEDHVLP